LLVVNLLEFVPLVGTFLAIPVWFLGLMNLFGLDFWETRVLFTVNWGLNALFHIFVLSVLVSSFSRGADHDSADDPDPNDLFPPAVRKAPEGPGPQPFPRRTR